MNTSHITILFQIRPSEQVLKDHTNKIRMATSSYLELMQLSMQDIDFERKQRFNQNIKLTIL